MVARKADKASQPAGRRPAKRTAARGKAATSEAVPAARRAASSPKESRRDTTQYNRALPATERRVCELLAAEIARVLPEAENNVWHAHPVWFLDGNPVVGYSQLKGCVRLLFWSGQSFRTPGLEPEGKFKAAEARFTSVEQIDVKALRRWLRESREIQWDYKNIVRRKGRLERLE